MQEDREVSIRELRTDLADIVNEVSTRGATVWLTNRGRRVAALVPLIVAEAAQQPASRWAAAAAEYGLPADETHADTDLPAMRADMARAAGYDGPEEN